MRYGFRRNSLRFTIAASLVAIAATFAHARKKAPRELAPLTREMTGDQRIAHALNRLEFGQRSADVDSIRRMGVDRWIEQQLNPDAIPENPVLEMKLGPLETLHMSSADLEEEYPAPATLRAIKEGRLSFTRRRSGARADSGTRRKTGTKAGRRRRRQFQQ